MDLTAFGNWLSSTSIVVMGAILIATLGAALYLGWLLKKKTQRDRQEGDPLLTSAVLGLLALLLSFTYSLAVERYEARRLLVQEEANAIGTMYLRTQLLEEPHRTEISGILVAYTDNRLALGHAGADASPELLDRNDRLLNDFWNASAAAFPSLRDLDFSSTFYDSVNALIDIDATRKSARLARVPPIIFLLLYVYIAVAAVLLGYFATTSRDLVQSCLFLALLVSFLVVVIDIDRPTHGVIRESQAPMERLRATLPN